ncbi:MAG: BatA domain-containing protein [Planctomycetaceae bacterium]|nr:BatA domain-containing protein [Planctomycetaceae bacterium]
MPTWFLNHFIHPGFAWSWAAAALIAAPIIIHLLNRLRYRRVRFAAMEFLLASEKRNKRRILIEQLLLLAMRVALVLLAILLIGRFTADAGMLDLFQEAQAHHVVLLDDSGSMLDRTGEETAFERAKEIVRRLATEGANQTGTQKFTLLLLSRPTETVAGLSERTTNAGLLTDLGAYLEDLACTYRRLPLAEGLNAAKARLLDDQSSAKFLHVLSDFREGDWIDDQAAVAALQELDRAEVTVNLVRSVGETHDNLAVTQLTGDLQAAARGVPVAFQVEVTNTGPRTAEDVRLTVAADGERLPLTIEFPAIESGEAVQQDFYSVFEQADRHDLSVTLEPDSLAQDNTRFVALDVPAEIPVLVIDGTPGQSQGQYVVEAIADAVGQDRVLTGVAAVLESPDYLRKYPLDGFQSILLINIPQLPEDGVVALERYVAAGGGLAWFLGNLVQPDFYNERLYRDGDGVFPVRLARTFGTLDHDPQQREVDVLANEHPLLKVLTSSESVLLQYVTINAWHPVEADWWTGEEPKPPTLQTIATLRNREPLILEHSWGPKQSRIVTFLTAAGPLFLPPEPQQPDRMWNNWASDENAAISYLVLQLELQKYIGRKDRLTPQLTVGEPIVRTVSPNDYLGQLEVTTPDDRVTELQAGPMETPQRRPGAGTPEVPPLQAVFRDTNEAGVYSVAMTRQDGTRETSLIACNVPADESRLLVASDEQLRRQLGETRHIEIRGTDAEDWLRVDSPGNELRVPLLVAMLLLLIVEQFLAHRFSYHP